MKPTAAKKFLTPLAAYGFLVALIIVSKELLGYSYAVFLSAVAMLLIPFLLDRRTENTLGFDARGFLEGAAISLVVLFLYAVCFYLAALHLGKTVEFRALSPLLALTHLAVIAFPEEFFFRGYMQRTLGGGAGSVVAASAAFALAHFLIICVFAGGGACAQNILTFFPSLVMGYLYMRTGTLWSSVFFHFAANVLYLSLRLA